MGQLREIYCSDSTQYTIVEAQSYFDRTEYTIRMLNTITADSVSIVLSEFNNGETTIDVIIDVDGANVHLTDVSSVLWIKSNVTTLDSSVFDETLLSAVIEKIKNIVAKVADEVIILESE